MLTYNNSSVKIKLSLMQGGRKMTKGELFKMLEGLDDNAHITVSGIDETCDLNIIGYKDLVQGDDIQNEITLVCG